MRHPPTSTLFPYTTLFRSIPDVHSEEAIEEARRIGVAVKDRDIRGRTDFRGVTTVTIDGEHARDFDDRSEEHTSELQSQSNLVCRLLLEKKKKKKREAELK